MPAQTIDEVIERLDAIIEASKKSKSRLGYFPALYRKVTVKVKIGIMTGQFEDNERMERLDVIFANRYLDAYDQYHRGEPTTRSWQLAFDGASRWWPVVLQHLILGMNAHIDLDLGIAAAEVMRGGNIKDLEADFMNINTVLSSMIDDVQLEIGEVWPLLGFFDLLAGQLDERLSRFGITRARDHAWRIANRLAVLPESDWPAEIARIDEEAAGIGEFVNRPGLLLRSILRFVRLGEMRTVRKVIGILE